MKTFTDAKNKQNKLKQDIKKYAEAYIDKLYNGEIPEPSNGDCWGCLMRAKGEKGGYGPFGVDHLQAHIEESYYVPSLIVRVVETIPASNAMKHTIACAFRGKD